MDYQMSNNQQSQLGDQAWYSSPSDYASSSAPVDFRHGAGFDQTQSFSGSFTQYPSHHLSGRSLSQPNWSAEHDFDIEFSPQPDQIKNLDISKLTTDVNEKPWQIGSARAPQTGHWSASTGPHLYGKSISNTAPSHSAYDDLMSTTNSEAIDSGIGSFHPMSMVEQRFPMPQEVTPMTVKSEKMSSRPMRRTASAKTDPHKSRAASSAGTAKRKNSAPVSSCNLCGKELLSRSDVTKHQKSHDKPYKCSYPTCAKHTEGFGTPNDCDRHERTKHHKQSGCAKDKGYICQACPIPPSGTGKWCPRLDNFKSHIKKKHPNADVEQLVSASLRNRRPDDDNLSVGPSGGLPTSHGDNDTQYQADQMSFSPYQAQPSVLNRLPSQQGETMPWPEYSTELSETHALAGLGEAQTADSFDFSDRKHHPSSHGADPTGYNSALPIAQELSPATTSLRHTNFHFQNQQALPDFSSAFPFSMDGLEQQSRDPTVVKTEEDTKPSFDDLSIASAAHDSTGKRYRCEHKRCRSTFRRECDRRKHHQRHERPYGCTWPRCYERHGSKSDWIRHESNMHKLPATWLCNFSTTADESCNTLFWDEQQLRSHIRLRHVDQCANDELADERVDDMLLGRHGELRFWCGFCRAVIPNPPRDYLEPWDRRCEHIGQHVDKKGGMHIKDWVCAEFMKTKEQLMEELMNGSSNAANVQTDRAQTPLPSLRSEDVKPEGVQEWERDLFNNVLQSEAAMTDE